MGDGLLVMDGLIVLVRSAEVGGRLHVDVAEFVKRPHVFRAPVFDHEVLPHGIAGYGLGGASA